MRTNLKLVKEIARKIKNNEIDISLLKEKYGQELIESACLFNTSKDRMAEIDSIRKNGHPLYITERLRSNCIGERVHDKFSATSYIAENRGKPFGTIVAIPFEKDGVKTVIVSITYISKDEVGASPTVGVFLAYDMAETALKTCTVIEHKFKDEQNVVFYTDNRTCFKYNKPQIYHFIKRALCYFWPEEYSYSKGVNKLHYFDESLHSRQEKIASYKK